MTADSTGGGPGRGRRGGVRGRCDRVGSVNGSIGRMTTPEHPQNPENPENPPQPASAARRDPWDLRDVSGLVVGVLGGTGPQGRGLAYRLARAGQQVIIGSRAADRARATAAEVGHGVTGADNAQCARRSDIVIVAVPYEGHAK